MRNEFEYTEDESYLDYPYYEDGVRDIVNEQFDSFICGKLKYDNYVDFPEDSWEYYN